MGTAKRTMRDIFNSGMMLSTYIFMMKAAFCACRRTQDYRLGGHVPTKWIIAGGLATGLGVLWEPPSRQEELAIYVVPQVRSYSQTQTHTLTHARARARTHTHTHTFTHTLTHSHCLQALTIVWNIARRRGLVPAVPAWEVIMFSLAMGVTMHHFERYQHSHCLVLCCVVLRQQVHSRSLTSTIAWFQGRDNSMCLLEQSWNKVCKLMAATRTFCVICGFIQRGTLEWRGGLVFANSHALFCTFLIFSSQ